MKRYGWSPSIAANVQQAHESQMWRVAMAVKLPLLEGAVSALSKFKKGGAHHQLLINARVPSIKYFELQNVSAEEAPMDAKAATPDAFQQLGGAYGQANQTDRDQRYKGICINLADAASAGERTEAVKTLLVTLWDELTQAGAECYYPEAPTGDTNIMYTDAIGRELLTPFSYSAFKPYQQTHGILFEEKYNPENHPDPIDGILFTPADLEGTRIQAPTVALYQQSIETENTYHQEALATLQNEIASLTQEVKEAKNEAGTTQSFQEILNNLIQQGTEFGNKREAVRGKPQEKKKPHPFPTDQEQKELKDALANSTTPKQRNLALGEATRAYYNSSLKPLVDQLLQDPYFKYYPKTPGAGKLVDSETLGGFIQLLSQIKLTQEGDITQKQENAKRHLETLAKEKVSGISTIQTLIADEEKLPLEEKSQEANLRQQLVALAIHRPNEAMVLYWRLVHIVQGKKATSTLETQKTAAEKIQETKAQTDFFNRLNSEPTPYRDQRKKDLINAIRSKTPEAASAFECGSKYYSSWGKRIGQFFGLIVIAAAGALGGAGLAGDFSAVKTVGDIFTATGADITVFESHTWILMSVCAALFLAAAVAGARWDRHHGQAERALADELRTSAVVAQV